MSGESYGCETNPSYARMRAKVTAEQEVGRGGPNSLNDQSS
jgi:hypothetical protein